MTLCVHRIEPKWPIESGRERHAISIEGTDYWAETSGGAPVLSDVRRVLGLDIDLAPLILAERGRRLAAGFDYAFGDARGTHRIGTTDADRKGWDEVSTYAGALIDSGDVETKINIVTDTGPCQVTAPEWRTDTGHEARTRAILEQIARRRVEKETRVETMPPGLAELLVEMSDSLDRIKLELIEMKRDHADTRARLECMERVTGNMLFKVSAA